MLSISFYCSAAAVLFITSRDRCLEAGDKHVHTRLRSPCCSSGQMNLTFDSEVHVGPNELFCACVEAHGEECTDDGKFH